MSSPSRPSQTPAGNIREDVSDSECEDPRSSKGERTVGSGKSVGDVERIRAL